MSTGEEQQPLLPLPRPISYALDLYRESLTVRGDGSLGMVLSGLDVWASIRSRGFLAKLVNEYALGSYKMSVFGLDPLDDLTISLCGEKYGPVCAGVNAFLGLSGTLEQRLSQTYSNQLNRELIKNVCSVLGFSSQPTPVRYSVSTGWIDLDNDSHRTSWPGTVGDVVPCLPSLCSVLGIGWMPTGTPKPAVGLLVMVDRARFMVVDGKWRAYRDSTTITPTDVSRCPGVMLHSECVSSLEFATFSLAFAMCGKAILSQGMSLMRVPDEGETFDNDLPIVTGFHQLFLAGESLAIGGYRVSLETAKGQRLPDLRDLQKSRAVQPEYGEHLDRTTALYDRFRRSEMGHACQDNVDDYVDLVEPDSVKRVAFWAPSARVEAAEHLAELIGARSPLGYRVMSDEKYNPALSFVAKPLGHHDVTADCNDLVRKESCVSVVRTSLGSVVCIPGARSGLLVPRPGKGIGESDCVPEAHEPCYPVLAAVGVIMVLRLDRDAGFMDHVYQTVRAEPTSLVTLCGDDLVRAASRELDSTTWSVREIMRDAERVVSKSMVGFVSRTAVTVLVRGGCLPTTASMSSACYPTCVRQLYGVRNCRGEIDCEGGVPMGGVDVFLQEDGAAFVRLSPPVLRSQRGVWSAFRITDGGRLDLEGSIARSMLSSVVNADDNAIIDEWNQVRSAEGADGLTLWGMGNLVLVASIDDVGEIQQISRGYCGGESHEVTAEDSTGPIRMST